MSSAVESSSLAFELMNIVKSTGSPYYDISVVIHAGGADISPLQVSRIDILRDYKSAYMDDYAITTVLGAGTAIYEVSPYSDDLKITIKKRIIQGLGKTALGDVTTRTFRAYLATDIPHGLENSNTPQYTDIETANRMKTMVVTFILEEVVVASFRKMSLGTIPTSCPPYYAMEALISNSLKSIKLASDEAINGFQIEEPSNREPRDFILIPDGTSIIDLPDLLQNDHGGIFSTGLGFYIQNDMVYAWPLYAVSRQATSKKLLQIFISPTSQTASMDRTWLVDGRTTAIWATGFSKVFDNSLDVLNTKGNGIRFTDSRKLIGNMGTVAGNKFTLNRSANNSEYVTSALSTNETYAKTTERKFTSNPFVEASRSAKNAGVSIIVPWKHSNPDLITPGTSATIFFDQKGFLRRIDGTVVGCNHHLQMQGYGITARSYGCTSTIELFVSRDDPTYQLYIAGGGSVSVQPSIDPL